MKSTVVLVSLLHSFSFNIILSLPTSVLEASWILVCHCPSVFHPLTPVPLGGGISMKYTLHAALLPS